jgi:hypothetical protein
MESQIDWPALSDESSGTLSGAGATVGTDETSVSGEAGGGT